MKKKNSPESESVNLPVSKQTAGGVAGAIVGSAIAGPIGAIAGAIAGTIMGNRSAKGKTLISTETVKAAQDAVKAVKQKLPSKLRQPGGKVLSPKKKNTKPTRSKKPSLNTKNSEAPVKAQSVKKPVSKRK